MLANCTRSLLQRHLVKVTGAKWDAADAAAAASGGNPDTARADELAQQLGVAAEHLKSLGVAAFAGSDAGTASRELQWFSAVAWNAGLSASAEPSPDWPSTARLFTAAGTFMDAALPAELADDSAASRGAAPNRQLAWLLAAGATLEAHASAEGSSRDALLADAQQALVRCAAAGEAAGANDGGRSGIYFMLLSFTANVRAGEESACLDLLRSAEAMPGLSPDTALKLARLAAAPDSSSGGAGSLVALRAYELCLRVMQRTPGVSFKDLSHALRKVLQLAEQAGGGGAGGADSRESRLLRAYREAASLLSGVPPGAYPPEEAHWLVTSSWNRGALLAKLGRADSAEVRRCCAVQRVAARVIRC